MKTYNFDFSENDVLIPILEFITETKNGDFNNGEKPIECKINENNTTENYLDTTIQNDEVLLFGLNY